VDDERSITVSGAAGGLSILFEDHEDYEVFRAAYAHGAGGITKFRAVEFEGGIPVDDVCAEERAGCGIDVVGVVRAPSLIHPKADGITIFRMGAIAFKRAGIGFQPPYQVCRHASGRERSEAQRKASGGGIQSGELGDISEPVPVAALV